MLHECIKSCLDVHYSKGFEYDEEEYEEYYELLMDDEEEEMEEDVKRRKRRNMQLPPAPEFGLHRCTILNLKATEDSITNNKKSIEMNNINGKRLQKNNKSIQESSMILQSQPQFHNNQDTTEEEECINVHLNNEECNKWAVEENGYHDYVTLMLKYCLKSCLVCTVPGYVCMFCLFVILGFFLQIFLFIHVNFYLYSHIIIICFLSFFS